MSKSEQERNPSHDLVTECLVKEALKEDVGPDAKLISWHIQDFTHKGDNYCSFVTSIQVKSQIDGKTMERSFIAKLNPLRPPSEVTEMLDNMFPKEATVLSKILVNLSSLLKSNSLPPLRVPRFYAANLTPRKEALLMEDLRTRGFQMYDRKKGMDVKHATLVMEELGRFHAASLLYQETLPNKSMVETYEDLVEPWMDTDHPVFKVFESMILGQVQNTLQLLKSSDKYQKCVKWIEKNMSNHGHRMTNFFQPKGNFVALTHGDSWTNNILFRYNEMGEPIELHLVDLQICRMAPITTDLNYFLYSSLTRNTRRQYMKLFTASYYVSFLKVFLMAGKKAPFTFQELEKEIEDKKLFGMYAAILLVPIVLSEEEEVVDLLSISEQNMKKVLKEQKEKFNAMATRGGTVFEERFLAVFDEMMEAHLFDD